MTDNTTQGCAAIIALIILIGVGIAVFFNGGCNRQVVDVKYRFEKAMIKMPDGTCKTVKVKSWRDYQDGDQIQVTDKDGNTYLGHACNIMLMSGED